MGIKHSPGGHIDTGLTQRALEHDDLDGVASQGEEVVVDAHLLHAQHRFEGGGHRRLALVFRCDIFSAAAAQAGDREGLAVQLAIGVDGELIQAHKAGRDHVVRQHL